MEGDSGGDDDMMSAIRAAGQKRQLSLEEIQEIIGNANKRIASETQQNNSEQSESDKQSTSTKNTNSEKTTTNIDNSQNTVYKSPTANTSLKMKGIINKKFRYLFYISTNKNINRLQLADFWKAIKGNTSDVILQTKRGFLLKSNTDKKLIIDRLEKMKSEKHITKFEETADKEKQPRNDSLVASYSAVISSVELEISDEDLSKHLNNNNIEHRFCKRIISKKTGKATYLIRIITGDIQSYEKLLNEGLFYKHRHYPAYTSLPPPPAPSPCSKCFGFDHKTEECTTPIKCHKCQGSHYTNKCLFQMPVKCAACNAEDHAAWSFKCPKRPTRSIPNIPNIQIKSINKKSEEIASDLKKENRIHSPVTKHDYIIDNYLADINNPKNVNREEAILGLRRKFIDLWRIDTAAVFTQNRLYILMFDLDSDQDSPTEPLTSPNNLQWRV